MTNSKTPEPDLSTFAGRRAAREAAEAAGEAPQKWVSPAIRAGMNEPQPEILESHRES